MHRYLEPDKMVPLNAIIAELARAQTAGRKGTDGEGAAGRAPLKRFERNSLEAGKGILRCAQCVRGVC
jgi:hypothetical protein